MDQRSRDLCLLVNILRQLCEEHDDRTRQRNHRSLERARAHLSRCPDTGRWQQARDLVDRDAA